MKKIIKLGLLALAATTLFSCGDIPGTTKQWTVQFMLNNGTEDIYKEIKVDNNSKISVSITDPTRNGYTFDGWYVDSACTVYFDEAGDLVTSDMKVYAKWASSGIANPDTPGNNTSSSEDGGSTSEDPVGDVITVYFSNNKHWEGDLYAHMWTDGGEGTTWPGEKMEYVETNDYSEKIFKVSVDTSIYSNIIFTNGQDGCKTCDIPLAGIVDSTGFYVDNETYGTYAYASTGTPDSGNNDNPGDGTEQLLTLYFTNNKGWTGEIKYYTWGTSGQKTAWPGEAMELVGQDDNGQDVYKVTVNVAVYNNIIFNDGSSQTADIPLNGVADSTGYYVNEDGKSVSTYTYSAAE